MARKNAADSAEPAPDEPAGADEAPPVHAHLGPVSEPRFNAATDDPKHPLHHHAKASNVPAEKD